jgi:tRNA(His) 5'-end guanylyltransferase
MSLFNKIQRYQTVFDNTLIYNCPIVIRCGIRNYSRFIRKLPKPYDKELLSIMRSTMYATVKELEGAIFAYQGNGEISYILKPTDDESPGPYSSLIQRINSITSSITTSNFLKSYLSSDEQPDIVGNAIFEAVTFSLPLNNDVLEYLIAEQQYCEQFAVASAVEEEISKILSNTDFLINKTTLEKKDILKNECGIIFDKEYDHSFRLGSCSFKAPKIYKENNNDVIQKKWVLKTDSINFIKEKESILNIINTGQNILDNMEK